LTNTRTAKKGFKKEKKRKKRLRRFFLFYSFILNFQYFYAEAAAFFAILDFKRAALFLWISPLPAALSSFLTAASLVSAVAPSALACFITVLSWDLAALLRSCLTLETNTLFLADLILGILTPPYIYENMKFNAFKNIYVYFKAILSYSARYILPQKKEKFKLF